MELIDITTSTRDFPLATRGLSGFANLES